ncbi:SGNH/GDSL hydrolase family protein [bacterium]|nr:SGNH/GDSL hydrolase family protein [candidate division CSSED10-310 bacterium]
MSSRGRRFAWIIVTILLSLVMAEAALRLTAVMLEARRRGDSNAEGKSTIWCFGDSNMYGVGADREQTLAGHLQALLPDHAVINYGKPGSNTWMHATELAYQLDYATPDIVIEWGGVNNDYNATGRGASFKIPAADRLVRNSRLYRLLRMLILTRFGFKPQPAFFGAEDTSILPVDSSTLSHDELLTFLESDFKKMHALTAARNIQFLVLTYPVHEADNARIMKAGRRLDLTVVDNFPLFQAFPPLNRHTLLFEDHHPNRVGYRLAALNVLSHLTEPAPRDLSPDLSAMVNRIVIDHELSRETVRFLFGEPLAIDRGVFPLVDPSGPLTRWTYDIRESLIHLFWDDDGRMTWAWFRSPNRIDPNAWSQARGKTRAQVRLLLGEPHEITVDDQQETWIYRHGVTTDHYLVRFAGDAALALSVEQGVNPEDLNDLAGMSVDAIRSAYGEPTDRGWVRYPAVKPRHDFTEWSYPNGLKLFMADDTVQLAVSPRSLSRSIEDIVEEGDSRSAIESIIGSSRVQQEWPGPQGGHLRLHSYDMGTGKFMVCYLNDHLHHAFIKWQTVTGSAIDTGLYELLPAGVSLQVVRDVWNPPMYWKERDDGTRIWVFQVTDQLFIMHFEADRLARKSRFKSFKTRISAEDFDALREVFGERLERVDGKGRSYRLKLPGTEGVFHFTPESRRPAGVAGTDG